jgi:hypothetical protein
MYSQNVQGLGLRFHERSIYIVVRTSKITPWVLDYLASPWVIMNMGNLNPKTLYISAVHVGPVELTFSKTLCSSYVS